MSKNPDKKKWDVLISDKDTTLGTSGPFEVNYSYQWQEKRTELPFTNFPKAVKASELRVGDVVYLPLDNQLGPMGQRVFVLGAEENPTHLVTIAKINIPNEDGSQSRYAKDIPHLFKYEVETTSRQVFMLKDDLDTYLVKSRPNAPTCKQIEGGAIVIDIPNPDKKVGFQGQTLEMEPTNTTPKGTQMNTTQHGAPSLLPYFADREFQEALRFEKRFEYVKKFVKDVKPKEMIRPVDKQLLGFGPSTKPFIVGSIKRSETQSVHAEELDIHQYIITVQNNDPTKKDSVIYAMGDSVVESQAKVYSLPIELIPQYAYVEHEGKFLRVASTTCNHEQHDHKHSLKLVSQETEVTVGPVSVDTRYNVIFEQDPKLALEESGSQLEQFGPRPGSPLHSLLSAMSISASSGIRLIPLGGQEMPKELASQLGLVGKPNKVYAKHLDYDFGDVGFLQGGLVTLKDRQIAILRLVDSSKKALTFTLKSKKVEAQPEFRVKHERVEAFVKFIDGLIIRTAEEM